jgi:hypothetical protein
VLIVVLAAGSLLVAVLALALAREVRLRRALELLLSRILAAWRGRRSDHDTSEELHDSADDNGRDNLRRRL